MSFAGKEKGADDEEKGDAGNQLNIKKVVEFPIKTKPFPLTWAMAKCENFDPSADDKDQQTVIYKVKVVRDNVISTDLLPEHLRFVRRVMSMSSKCNSGNANERVTNQ